RPEPVLGLWVEPLSRPANQPGQFVVRDVVKTGPSFRVGILVDDVITRLDNKVPADIDDVYRILEAHKPEDEVPVRLVRAGKELDFTVKLVDRTALARPQTDLDALKERSRRLEERLQRLLQEMEKGKQPPKKD